MSNEQDLGTATVEGVEVTGVAIKLTNAGDGLSKSMEVEARILQPGERVTVLIEGVVQPIRFDPVRLQGGDRDYSRVTREQSIKAELATIVDPEVGRDILDAHRAALDKLAGQPQIDFDGDADDDEWMSDDPPRPDAGSEDD